jgi:hypothetical protein
MKIEDAKVNIDDLRKRWDKRFDTEELQELRDLVAAAIKRQQKGIENAYNVLGEEQDDDDNAAAYRDHLRDQFFFTKELQHLSDELVITGLYKKVELLIKSVALRKIKKIKPKALSSIRTLKESLPFDIEKLGCYSAHSELRLVNNSIKHEGKVSKDLAKDFPHWTEGADLDGLDACYERLLPQITIFIHAFVDACYLHAGSPPRSSKRV